MTPEAVVIRDSASSPKFFNVPLVLKVAAILLTINVLLVGWFWISPNWGASTEPQHLAEGSSLAEAKPSPFYLVEEEARRAAKKAMKLKPIVVTVEPPPEVAAVQTSTESDLALTDPGRQRAEDALVARYAETRAGDRP